MNKQWILITDGYEGLQKNAVNTLYATLSGYLGYVLTVKTAENVTDKELTEYNTILIGKNNSNELIDKCCKENVIDIPQTDEGYSIYVGSSIFCNDSQMIVIAGFDSAGILYGCMDFCNRYCGDIIYKHKNIWSDSTYDNAFDGELNTWKTSTKPAIKNRAIWTWGHVIYDYRKFFENMAKLRLNQVVIWNDVVPFNAKDIVEYAHSLNIKVIWGFAWGWGRSCEDILDRLSDQSLADLKKRVLDTYRREYFDTGCDGIYFQSFTELKTDYVNGKCVAQIVTDLVNDIAGALLEQYPTLHIQFGLHATSVNTHLDILEKVDSRIYIVWEDCGSFPYNYYVDEIDDFDSTYKFTEKLLKLRGKNENFGAVFKGMLKLDWTKFEHFSDTYILGERTNSYLKNRQIAKNRIWKIQQAEWLKNAQYIRKTVELIAGSDNETIVQALVEDAMFENKIIFPIALYAQMLWTPDISTDELIKQVSKYPCVEFANI